jgi:hypothetical protein
VGQADPELERFLHLWAMNRGVLMTPFHNMALMSPATTEADVDRHSAVFGEAVEACSGIAPRRDGATSTPRWHSSAMAIGVGPMPSHRARRGVA